MKDLLEFMKFFISAGILCVISIVLILVSIYSVYEISDYIFDKSYCIAYIEQNEIYNGRCHFIRVDSIGENGNTKHLSIYKDALKLKAIKHYVNEDIQIKGE